MAAYLFPPINESEASIVDIDAVREVCYRYNVSEDDVTAALLSDDPHHHLSIAYNLIVDNKRIADETAKLSVEEFYNMQPAGRLHHSDAFPQRHHPERIVGGNSKITATLGHTATPEGAGGTGSSSGDSPAQPPPQPTTPQQPKSPHVKRAKWHLGIRSQSRPDDIMYEVFRAMKYLDFEWKMLNAYHVVVRRKPKEASQETPKMSLQLYQVDQRSYLLDFKNLVDDESTMGIDGSCSSSRHASVSMPVRPSMRCNRAQSLPMPIEVGRAVAQQQAAGGGAAAAGAVAGPSGVPTALDEPMVVESRQSQTMQFFEMSAALIGALAR